MTSTFVLATLAMAVVDLGIGFGAYRIYRWASSDAPAPAPVRAPRPAAPQRPARHPDLAGAL